MKRTSLLVCAAFSLLFIACESLESELNQKVSLDVPTEISSIETQEDFKSYLDHHGTDELTDDQKRESVLKYFELGGKRVVVEDSGRYPLCGTNGLFYPNGNNVTPCLVRHKITYLADYFARYEDEVDFFLYFEFDAQPSCHEYVYSVPFLYTFECLVQQNTQPMEIFMVYWRLNSDTGQYEFVERLVCGTGYSCG